MKKLLLNLFRPFLHMYQDYKASPFVKTVMYFLPIVILLYECVIWLLSLLEGVNLTYDEFLLLHISNQPLLQMLDTVQVEPHPLGFYLLLKVLLNLGLSQLLIKLALIINFFCISVVAILIGYGTKMIQKFNLSVGLSLVMVSYQVFSLFGSVKQDIISFPLFLLFFISTISFYFGKTYREKHLFLLKLLALTSICLIAVTSYIYTIFVFTILCILLLISIQRKDKYSVFFITSLSLLTLISAIYFFLYGHYQIENNFLHKNRFLWTSEIENSFILKIPESIAGVGFHSLLADGITFFFIFLFVVSVAQFIKHIENQIFSFFLFCFFIVSAFLSYYLRLFVQTRYSVPVFVVFLIICSLQTNKIIRKALLIFIFSLLFTNYLNLKFRDIEDSESSKQWIETIEEHASVSPLGIISNLPTESVYLKNKLFNNNPHIFAISTSTSGSFISSGIIDKETLSEFSDILQMTTPQLTDAYQQSNLTSFIFFEFKEKNFQYYDQENRIQESLYRFCDEHENIQVFSNSVLHYFSDCHPT